MGKRVWHWKLDDCQKFGCIHDRRSRHLQSCVNSPPAGARPETLEASESNVSSGCGVRRWPKAAAQNLYKSHSRTHE